MSSGCGCKEVYRFPHITYPYSSCICSFLQQHPYFLFIFLNVFRFIPVHFCNLFINFFAQYKRRSTHKRTLHTAMDISCMTSRSVV